MPHKRALVADEAFKNFQRYVHDMFRAKVEETQEGKMSQGMDILGALVRSSYSPSPPNSRTTSPIRSERPKLTDSEIMGNAFVMLFAGHETTSNSILFSLIELAINPAPQREAQRQVHELFEDSDPETWQYDTCINALLNSMVGAILNEQLRLTPPVPNLPKSVSKEADQELRIDGRTVYIPAGSNIGINTIGVQRNPRYWPTQPSTITKGKNDLDDFKPERWLLEAEKDEHARATHEDDVFGAATGTDSSAEMFRPVNGSYIPFSAGPHSCLGRRLAQIEVVAVLAVILQKYSVELAVDEWASDAEVANMTLEARRAVYEKAQIKARETIRSARVMLTLKLSQTVPMRLVEKGSERFFDLFP